jgi:hypothetical protein
MKVSKYCGGYSICIWVCCAVIYFWTIAIDCGGCPKAIKCHDAFELESPRRNASCISILPLFQDYPSVNRPILLLENACTQVSGLSFQILVLGEFDYDLNRSAVRVGEILNAMRLSQRDNPQLLHVIGIPNPDLSLDIFQGLHVHIWYYPEFLYGTLFQIADMYSADLIKIPTSLDNHFPPIAFNCSFGSNYNKAFTISRAEGNDPAKNCNWYAGQGSFDGIMYKGKMPIQVYKLLRFSRAYWGCENLAAWVLQQHGYELTSICPVYFTWHMHDSNVREAYERPRINAYSSSPGNAHLGELCH